MDAIVVGAGPAGGMAARTIAKAGFDVLIIDRKKVVGEPVQCGEGLSRFALEHNSIPENDEWISKRIVGAKIICPGNTWFYITRNPGYSIYRDRFDRWITDGAVDMGAELLLNTSVTGIRRRDDQWIVRTKNAEYTSGIVIGADGPKSSIARWLGWMRERRWLTSLEYRFDEKDLDYPDKDHFHLYASTVYGGGYAWVFPREGEYNVGVGSFVPVKEMLHRFCKELNVDPGKRKATTGGLIPYRYTLDHYSKEGVVICGDAAGTTNPMSGGGIHAALNSGRMAGEAVVEALEAEDAKLVEAYDRRLRRAPFMNPLLWKMSSYMIRWDEETLEFIGWMIHGKDQSEMTKWEGFKKMIRRPKFFRYSRQFMMMQKAMKICEKYGW